jgi:hypothetical protein
MAALAQKTRPPAQDVYREQLAVAHAELWQVQRELKAAQDARTLAVRNWIDATRTLDGLEGNVEDPAYIDDRDEAPAALPEDESQDPDRSDIAESFISSVKIGAPADVDTLTREVRDNEAALKKARLDAETWDKTRLACAMVIPERQRAVESAKRKVKTAAAAVVQRAGAVGPLLQGLAEMERAVFERRLALMFLLQKNLLADKDVADVKAVLRSNLLPGISSSAESYEWHRDPVWVAWSEALAALEKDSAVPLPGATS